ncbi:MAG: F0F1 ATP synthase subunit delta [Methylophilaceae bacterium]|nr:F0F1 ATP synthase subunit delta [Methylophilaceae bacterium]
MAEISTIARPYAVAAFKFAKEKNALAKWSDMLSLASTVSSDETLHAVIQDPKVDGQVLQDVFLKVCGKKLDKHGQNMIKTLVEYKRLSILPAISSAFEDLKAEDEGSIDARIVAAIKPTVAVTKDLVKKLEAKFGKKVTAEVEIDPEIIGGMKIIVGDTVIDASIKGQLQNLAYSLTA